ncbi:uncharacterized protein LOC104658651 isoform X1 [Rhinopithecus roxellana]|uniref:uncharacterized protein LOC104658651 isoform X1 n=1 Tax=Rhinopithecus roxellana TaxID=61622 RepID=UPI0012372855|nr:uncharacterized protein LOC104658651 isoform X1 [Rhinopithecus roxellana]
MATYPPRRLLGARPLPSDRRRDPRRSGFPPGGGGRWERRLQSSRDRLPQPLELVRVLLGPAPRHRHLLSSEFPSDETTGVFTHHPHLFFFQPDGRKYIMESKFLKHGLVV